MSNLITLNDIETRQLSNLESVIERGQQTFIEVGKALAEIKSAKLYRQTHGTFDKYIEDRWGWTIRTAQRLMKSASVAEEIRPMGRLPTSERQIRPLVRLTDEDQYEAWKRAHEIADTEAIPVTAKVVERAVQEINPRKETYQVVAESHADKAIVWIDQIDMRKPGADAALIKVFKHCKKRLGELNE